MPDKLTVPFHLGLPVQTGARRGLWHASSDVRHPVSIMGAIAAACGKQAYP